MAKTKSPTVDDKSTDSDVDQLLTQRTASWDAIAPVRSTWSDKERLLIARLSDTFSQKSTRSHVTDGHLSTLAFERQSRVASQLPTGKIYALSSKDDGAAMLMNLVLEKYVMPNANSQFDLLTKLRMSGVYASVYGAQPMLYDYKISDDYIGPDVWLIPIRNFLPQPGKNSVEDMDWCMVSKIESISYLDEISKRKSTSWNTKNVKKLIKAVEEGGSTPERDINSDKKTAVENIRSSGRPYADKGGAKRVELVTKYEKGSKGHWITFAPDYKEIGVLRDIPNPHKNGRIPIVMRQCFPLLDSVFGLGDFERGMTLQKAKDSLINLYMDAVKLSIFPPIKMDLTGVTASTIRYEAGARWLMKDLNAVAPYQTSPQGMETFQGTYQFLTTALLNQNGTTDTASTQEDSANPAYGKTPAAIQQLQERENARDNWDRFMLEKTMERLFSGMINLIGENQEKPINFHLFDEDIDKIEDQFGEDELQGFCKKVNKKVCKMTIPKSMLGGEYKYIVDASSSMANDQKQQDASLQEIIELYLQNNQQGQIDMALAKDKMSFNLGNAFKQKIIATGVNDWDDIIVDHTDEEMAEEGQEGQQPMQPPMGQPQMPQGMPPEQAMPPQQQPPQPQQPQGQQMPQFQDPQIAQMAQQMFGGQGG